MTDTKHETNDTPPTELRAPIQHTNAPMAVDLEQGAALVRYPSLENRFVHEHTLKIMDSVPQTAPETLDKTTIITPSGVHQWNEELQKIICLVSPAQLGASYDWLKTLMQQANTLEHQAYEACSQEQLNQLSHLVLLHRGHHLLGYDINEELLTWLLGVMTRKSFPPEPGDWNRRLLTAVRQPLAVDVAVSIRTMAQAFLVFVFCMDSYFAYMGQTTVQEYNFEIARSLWIVMSMSGLAVSIFILLRSPCIEKQTCHHRLAIVRNLLEYAIRFGETWTNYGSLMFPTTQIMQGFLPVVSLGLIAGSQAQESTWLNIHSYPYLHLILHALFFSLGVSSLIGFGLQLPIADAFISEHKNYDDPTTAQEYDQYCFIGRCIVLILSFLSYCAQFSNVYLHRQLSAVYLSNAWHGISLMLLDANILFIFYELFLYVFDQDGSVQYEPIMISYYLVQLPIIFYSMCVTFSTTKNLPKLSTEITNHINPDHKYCDSLTKYSAICVKKIPFNLCIYGSKKTELETSLLQASQQNATKRDSLIQLV